MWSYNYINSYSYKNELKHFGILGMHWGIRRYQDTNGRFTSAGRDRYLDQKETNIEGFTIPSGTALYRVSTKKEDDGYGPKYVTMTKIDRDMYKGDYSRTIAENQSGDPNANIYEQKFVTNTDLKVPSHEEVKKVEQELKNDPKVQIEVGEAWATSYLQVSKQNIDYMKETVKDESYQGFMKGYMESMVEQHKTISSLYETGYKNAKDESSLYKFAASIGISDYNKAALIRSLKDKGYNAVTDEYGVGGGSTKESYVKEGVQPLIVFDSGSMNQLGSSKVSGSEKSKSNSDYMKWYNEKNYK